MSLPEVWDHLKEIWGSADKANDDLVPLHFWKVMVRRYGEGTDLMIEMSYNVLARLDELSYDINVELFKDIIIMQIVEINDQQILLMVQVLLQMILLDLL